MSYIIHKNQLVSKTKKKYEDGKKVYFVKVGNEYGVLEALQACNLLRKREDCSLGEISNDKKWKEEADKLDFFCTPRSESMWSIEALIPAPIPF